MKNITIENNVVIISEESVNNFSMVYTCDGEYRCLLLDKEVRHRLNSFAKELLSERINHCERELISALKSKKCGIQGSGIVSWEGGHFSQRTYDDMREALIIGEPTEWRSSIWAQVIKQYTHSISCEEIAPVSFFMDYAMEMLISAKF